MKTECEAERVIKQLVHKMEVDMGNGVVNYGAILNILRQQGNCPCAA